MEILKFNPIYKPTLWGSETWAISAVKGSESVVMGGEDKGLTLPQVVERYGADFLGKANSQKFGHDFPLLIKFIDARQDLHTGTSQRRTECQTPRQDGKE